MRISANFLLPGVQGVRYWGARRRPAGQVCCLLSVSCATLEQGCALR
ncbi:hypothetical protein A2U01_0065809, partial [Trifolium medium]|nr:hypothetical protein [Trifolium medium]